MQAILIEMDEILGQAEQAELAVDHPGTLIHLMTASTMLRKVQTFIIQNRSHVSLPGQVLQEYCPPERDDCKQAIKKCGMKFKEACDSIHDKVKKR